MCWKEYPRHFKRHYTVCICVCVVCVCVCVCVVCEYACVSVCAFTCVFNVCKYKFFTKSLRKHNADLGPRNRIQERALMDMELHTQFHKRWVHFSHLKIITFSTSGLPIHMQLFIVTLYLGLFKSVKILTLNWKKKIINNKEWMSIVISGIKGKPNTYIGGIQWSS